MGGCEARDICSRTSQAMEILTAFTDYVTHPKRSIELGRWFVFDDLSWSWTPNRLLNKFLRANLLFCILFLIWVTSAAHSHHHNYPPSKSCLTQPQTSSYESRISGYPREDPRPLNSGTRWPLLEAKTPKSHWKTQKDIIANLEHLRCSRFINDPKDGRRDQKCSTSHQVLNTYHQWHSLGWERLEECGYPNTRTNAPRDPKHHNRR